SAVQHRAVHMDGLQRLSRGSQSGSVRRMCMHYGFHVRALAVDPDVEPDAGIRAAAFQRLQVLVDQHHALRGRFLEAVAELQRPERPGVVGARGDLPGEARFMIFLSQDPAAGGEQARRRTFEERQVLVHLAAHPLDEVGLRFHFMKLGSQSERIGKATRMARRTQSMVMNGSTPRKMTRVGTCGSRVLRTNRFMPTGGLMSPISTTTTMRMPK